MWTASTKCGFWLVQAGGCDYNPFDFSGLNPSNPCVIISKYLMHTDYVSLYSFRLQKHFTLLNLMEYIWTRKQKVISQLCTFFHSNTMKAIRNKLVEGNACIWNIISSSLRHRVKFRGTGSAQMPGNCS